ncbi:MAG: hypothetical protein U0169_19435 [Polyangiaceae bacterium]
MVRFRLLLADCPTFALTTLLLASVAAAPACGPPAGQARSPVVYPRYDDEGRRLFGDTIDAAAVGLEMSDQQRVSHKDAILGDRTMTADWVAKVRIATVTARDRTERGEHFDVTLRTVERYAGQSAAKETFVLRVEPHDESYGLVRSFGERLVGRDFIGFFRAYATPEEDEPIVHFHLTKDSPELEQAVKGAATVNELR